MYIFLSRMIFAPSNWGCTDAPAVMSMGIIKASKLLVDL